MNHLDSHRPGFALVALAAALALAVPTTAPAGTTSGPGPERQNALALDNGAVIVSDGGSYSKGVAEWAAFNLSNGDEKTGWCSPSGMPTDLAFDWELDTTWKLDTLAVSTRNMQEAGYPGISVRVVDLWLDSGTGFAKVGSFELAKGTRKEFPLPAGTRGRQVRIVVAANHGNKEFTEIAEVELFGERAAPVDRPLVAGDFVASYGPMRFAVDGETVYGCYDYVDGAAVWGTLDGRNARVTWLEPQKDGSMRQGKATFVVSQGGKTLTGVWYEDGRLKGTWDGTRSDKPVARCTPQRRSALDDLRKQRHLALYGIRFDSGKDVLRPESDATLDEVAGILRQDPALRLLVEGHTDATNTDTYNLGLSERRAQAVVVALVKRGIDGGRLQAKGFGKSRPVADNATAQGRALNRRVEISLPD
jgi:outer membrane protein OmpA-like peptidoglycan-associated protein